MVLLMLLAEQSKGDAWPNDAKRIVAAQSKGIAVQCPALLIQDIGDPQQVLGWPKMDINCFCCPGVGVPETCANKLNGNAFFIHSRAEIMPQGMRTEARNPGVPGKLYTETV